MSIKTKIPTINLKEKENVFLYKKHILLCNIESYLNPIYKEYEEELYYIKKNFCGNIFSDVSEFNNFKCLPKTIIYICGDIEKTFKKINLINIDIVYIIKEFSCNFKDIDANKYQLINSGQVPINMYNTGVYFRNFFKSDKNYFNSIVNEHKFQSLTESTKKTTSYRKGIYLTKTIAEQGQEKDEEIKFNLLRCSTNLNGPTDNFRKTDTEIIDSVNNISKYFYKEKVELNHVLAQIYYNVVINNGTHDKQKKARISKHSDKTKDMPRNAIMAFCTFYKDYSKEYYKKESILTKLRFRLKKDVIDENLSNFFDIYLYPNSLFLMDLSTNRLYTHEIVPSNLPIDKLPTRMGYVIRCSNTKAIFKNNQTYIVKNGKNIKLEESTIDEIKRLKQLYYKENSTIEMIYYDNFHFSLNNGDYTKPLI